MADDRRSERLKEICSDIHKDALKLMGNVVLILRNT